MQPGIFNNTARGRHSECFVYIVSGKTEYQFGDRLLTAQAGDVLYLAKNSRYKMNVMSEYRVIYTDFDLLDDAPRQSAVFKNLRSAEELFRKLQSHRLRSDPASNALCLGTVYDIYAHICEKDTAKRGLSLLSPAIEYINENFAEQISVSHLAKLCSVSETHMRRLFSEHLGVSPVQYIASIKLSRAKEMLRYDPSDISDIAQTLGFSGVFYFCRFFKKETGMTPGNYRRLFDK